MRSEHIIDAKSARSKITDPNVVLLEATFFLPVMGRDAVAEFEQTHIRGAQFFDIDAIADTTSDLPHMLPSAAQFTKQIQSLGINNSSEIIVYDRSPFLSAARCWWMFRYFGHSQIRVLDGGFTAWLEAEGAVESGIPEARAMGAFETGAPADTGHMTLDALRAHLSVEQLPQILDARPQPRFEGTADEPRPGLPSGHMRGACNLPIMDILDDRGFLRHEAELKALVAHANIDLSQPIITTCGSGVTAAGLTLALATIGMSDVSLYDGSWAEWASQPDADIVTGPA